MAMFLTFQTYIARPATVRTEYKDKKRFNIQTRKLFQLKDSSLFFTKKKIRGKSSLIWEPPLTFNSFPLIKKFENLKNLNENREVSVSQCS